MTQEQTGRQSPLANVPTQKKGFGLPERKGKGAEHLDNLKVAWYYNWGAETKLKTSAEFVPMLFSMRRLDSRIDSEILLGYNEPDHPKQANMTVRQALDTWPKVVKKAKRVGAPAMAGNPIRGTWFPAFMAEKPTVHFIPVHWYKGVDSARFIREIEEIHTKYDKPIWVTEFAAQTAAQSREKPTRHTQSDVDRFILEVTAWMALTDYVERYAWHDSGMGTSALFETNGSLTATGKIYSSIP